MLSFFFRVTVEQFVTAAAAGDEATVQRGLTQKTPVRVNTTDSKGQTALHLAVKHKRGSIVSLLITNAPPNCVDVHARDKSGSTPLHIAAACNVGAPIIQELLSNVFAFANGDDIMVLHHIINNTGPSHSYQTQEEAVQWLRFWLEHGPYRHVDSKVLGTVAEFAMEKNLPTVAVFLQKYQHNSAPEQKSTSSTMGAIMGAAAVDVDALTAEQFREAAQAGNEVAVRRGLNQRRPVDINAADATDGCTALHFAVQYKNAAVVSLLLANPSPNVAHVNARSQFSRTPLHFAAAHNAGAPIIQALLLHKADVTATNSFGSTVLHIIISNTGSAENYRTEVDAGYWLQFWLARGARACLTVKTKNFNVPALYAASKGLPNVAKLLHAASTFSEQQPQQQPKPKPKSKSKPKPKPTSNPTSKHSKHYHATEQKESSSADADAGVSVCHEPLHTQLQAELETALKLVDEAHRTVDEMRTAHEQAHGELKRAHELTRQERDDALTALAQAKAQLAQQAQAQAQALPQPEHKKAFSKNGVREEDLIYDEERDKLGDGMSGVVYRARFNGADIAAKFFRSSAAVEHDFMRELSMMTSLPPHPNVVGFLGSSSTKPFILTMTLMRGSLEQLIMQDKEFALDFGRAKGSAAVADQTLLNLRRLVWFLVGASAGLMHLHANRVVHGDVAARNFLVDYNLNCCVCDFGLSHVLPEGESSVTAGKEARLPIAWCAPETLQQRVWSEKSDVYSFGITMVEVLACHEPYPGLDLVKQVAPGVCKKEPHTLRPHLEAWWPAELTSVVESCCDAHTADRPSMASVNKLLRRYHKRLCDAAKLEHVYPLEVLGSEAMAAASASANAPYKCIPAAHYYLTPNYAALS